MIQSKNDYIAYLKDDLKSHNLEKWRIIYRWNKPILVYQRKLRKIEYIQNCKKSIFSKIYLKFLKFRFLKLSIKLGFTIAPNSFSSGLALAHWGSIVVNGNTRVGKNCRVHSAVNIGISEGKCPIIGDNCYIGPGAKIYGGITIGDNVTIGANSVVNKNVPSNVTIAGVPAKIIGENKKII